MFMLFLGLGLMLSEVCIRLITRCLCAALLYSKGLLVLRDYTNCASGVIITSVLERMRTVVFYPEA